MRSKHIALVVSLAAALASMAGTAGAHGMAGKRFFPATLATDDPFVADELSLPTVQHIKRPADGDHPATRETEVSGEFSKRLSPNFGFSLGGTWRALDPDDGKSVTGFDNLEVALRGLKASLDRARPVLDGLQRDHTEAVADLYGELESCDVEAAIKAMVTLKGRLERGTA